MTEIICVPIIVALTYGIIELYKKIIAKQNEILNRIIPIIGLVLGGFLGVVCFYAFPELIVAHNIVSAIIVGASSGLSATGCNQILKQLKNFGITVSEPQNANNQPNVDAAKNDENSSELNKKD